MKMKKKYQKPFLIVLKVEEFGSAYYGAMASSCCQSGARCG